MHGFICFVALGSIASPKEEVIEMVNQAALYFIKSRCKIDKDVNYDSK